MIFLDWVILILWLGITLSGFWKGAVRIVFGLGGIVVGLWLAVVAGPQAESVLAGVIGDGWIAAALARLLLVLACAILFLVAGWGLQQTLEALHMGWLNRVTGAVLAGAVGVVLLAVFVGFAARLSPGWEEWSHDSVFVEPLAGVWLAVAVPQETATEAGGPESAVDDATSEPADDPPESEGSISR